MPSAAATNAISGNFVRGNKFFELSNHLGNVLVTISDRKMAVGSGGTVAYYTADVLTAQDYYPFGMVMPGRKFSAGGKYRYGFNGKENDNEVKGEGGQQDYGMRIYDPRLGRFLSVDPLTNSYPKLTPYQFASNRPIDEIDQDGEEYKPYYHARTYKSKAFDIRPVKGDPGARTYSIKDFGTTVRVYEKVVYESTKDAMGNVHHFNTYYFVEDKAIVNDKNTMKPSGGGFATAGTNWHYWMNDMQSSTQSKLNDGVANGIGTAFFGGALAIAAAPALSIIAPAAANAASTTAQASLPYVKTAASWSFNNLVLNGGKVAAFNVASGAGDFIWQTAMNGGDIRKNNWTSTAANTFIGLCPQHLCDM